MTSLVPVQMAVHRRHRDMRQDVKVTADEAGDRKKAVSAATYNDERPAKKQAAGVPLIKVLCALEPEA